MSMMFRSLAFATLMLLAVISLRAVAFLLTTAYRLRPAAAMAPMPPLLIDGADMVEAPERYAVTMSIGEIMDRTVH
jgi:hypothetical protein